VATTHARTWVINHPQRGDVKSHTCDHKSMLIEGLYLYIYIHGATMRKDVEGAFYVIHFCVSMSTLAGEDYYINLKIIHKSCRYHRVSP